MRELLGDFEHVHAAIVNDCPLLAVTSLYNACATHAIVLVAVSIVSGAVKGALQDPHYDDFLKMVKSVLFTIKNASGGAMSFTSWKLDPGPKP